MVLNGVPFTINILWLIPLIIELFIFSLSIAFILSTLYVRFRDVNYIWVVVLQAGFYATPILYPITLVVSISPLISKIMMLNPIAQIMQDARHLIITQDAVTIGGIYGNTFARLMPLAIVIIFAVIGSLYFKKKSPSFAEEI
jgi:ABC-2 type transport system permease protein